MSFTSILEIIGALLLLLSVSGAALLSWTAITRSRISEEILLSTAATALLSWFGTRTLLFPIVVLWGYAALFAVVTVCAVLHTAKMWPDYVAVTVTTLAICLAGYLFLFDVVG